QTKKASFSARLPGPVWLGRDGHQTDGLNGFYAHDVRAPKVAGAQIGAQALQALVRDDPGNYVVVQRLEDDLNVPAVHISRLRMVRTSVCEESRIPRRIIRR